MAWRGLHLSRSAHLSVEHRCLRMEFRDGTPPFRLPLEDLSYLVLDTPEVTLSGRLLAELSSAQVMVLGTDEKHLPCWSSLPWTSFHAQGHVLSLQMEMPLPLRKQLWSRIVELKIQAQAAVLQPVAPLEATYLAAMISQVRSGDPDNVEARAARAYWGSLFKGQAFLRHTDDLPNALLNYGYAILRSALARCLCATGFIPQLGIHHESQTNAYNLADDLIEPYRPWVDQRALLTLGDSSFSEEFTTEHRRSMAQIMECQPIMQEEKVSMMIAIETTVDSLKHALREKEAARLLFPESPT
ncbi:MAG: type II CRISPR-associated endonuclease Cas1 [Blastochloris sp.]|nr:type II CRISPR-associated endonuclease Cas1 [Blastochloris sp.]